MKRMWIVVWVVGLVAAGMPGVVLGQGEERAGGAAVEAAPWLRMVEERGGAVVRLEVAVREFEHADGSLPRVTVAGVAHIGEPELYASLQQILDAHDVVLFEGVMPQRMRGRMHGEEEPGIVVVEEEPREEGVEPGEGTPQGEGQRRRSSPQLQQQLADAMGLVFQLEAMDHSKPHWRNSDMSLEELRDRLRGAAEGTEAMLSMLDGSSMTARFSGALLGMLGRSEQSRGMLKAAMIEMLAEADRLIEQMPGRTGAMMSVLLEERNEVVLADLQRLMEEEPDVSSVGIIYGAGHLPHMERRLTEDMGFAASGERWLVVMRVDAEEAGIAPGQMRAVRQMVRQRIERGL